MEESLEHFNEPMTDVSDEEYLVLRARSCQISDPYATKAWLITAKTLFPSNFGIQFEVYTNEKTSRNTKEAARYLEDLYRNFQSDPGLWKEVQNITEALQSDVVDGATSFLREMFSMLPPDIQHEMLLSTADRSEDTQEHCKLLLLLLKKFPDKIALHGMKLMETLLTAEKHSHQTSPVNCFRKLLVHDILPLIFKSPRVEFHTKQLYRLLNKCIEFYVTYITLPPVPSGANSHQPIPGLQESESLIENPWTHLANIFKVVGQKLNWELQDLFLSSSKEHQWQRIQTFYQNPPHGLEDAHLTYKQVFFCASILFIQSLYEYTSKADPEQFGLTAGNTAVPSLVLIEGFRNPSNDCPEQVKNKKRRMDTDLRDEPSPSFVVSKVAHNSTNIIVQSFITASRCWELLHSNDMFDKEFKRLSQQLRMDTWSWNLNFQLDLLIYQGQYQEAVTKLKQLEAFGTASFQNKINLRMASCLFAMGMNSAACERVLPVVNSLPKPITVTSSNQSNNPFQNNSPGRQLHFINYDRQEVLQYCVRLIHMCFKERALQPGVKDDQALGHLLVLLQYDWPQSESLFTQAVEKIKEQGSFSYNLFFSYIINIDMLEEFAYLAKYDGGIINLDLLQVSTAQIAKQRTITRGVNKGAKEDFRSAMERQVARCDEPLDQLLIQFLTQEREAFHF